MKNIVVKTVGSYINVLGYISKQYAAGKALKLFTKPRKGKITEEQASFLNTAFTEEFSYKDTPIMTYRWPGHKETILLAHGWESNSSRWQYLICDLKQKGYTIVALDAPGHGNSGNTYFNALLYAEFIHVVSKRFSPEIIIAHSVGGMAATVFQKKYQIKSVQKLILLGAPSEFKDIISRYVDLLGYNNRVSNQLNITIEKRFGTKPEQFSTAKLLKDITTKGLIIHDKQDPVIPYEDALLIQDEFKNSTLITTEGLGHSLKDNSIIEHINQFLEA
ncbi:alpha/beta hydrolase [Formosa sp. S-31]|uniref:alpha/beta hydrolase n=1 Tax=Formosa sp. S-31 TaxID=2790949 RepID=UPI003EB70853